MEIFPPPIPRGKKKRGGKEERGKGRKTDAVYEYVNEGEEEYQKQSLSICIYTPKIFKNFVYYQIFSFACELYIYFTSSLV